MTSGTRRRYGNDQTTQRLHRRSFISLQRASATPRPPTRSTKRQPRDRRAQHSDHGCPPPPRPPRRTDPRVPTSSVTGFAHLTAAAPTITEYRAGITAGSEPVRIAAGPDG